MDKTEIFPSFYPNLKKSSKMQGVLTTNHEVTRDLEFDHLYILEMIEKFSISPNQYNKCNDLSKVFMNPEYYYNNLYIKKSSWKLNAESILSLDIEPYNHLKIPLFDKLRRLNSKMK